MSTEEDWHMNKGLNITHIVTTIMLLLGGVMYVNDIRESVAVHGTKIQNLERMIDTKTAQHEEMFKRIDTKLDKLFEIIYKSNKDD